MIFCCLPSCYGDSLGCHGDILLSPNMFAVRLCALYNLTQELSCVLDILLSPNMFTVRLCALYNSTQELSCVLMHLHQPGDSPQVIGALLTGF